MFDKVHPDQTHDDIFIHEAPHKDYIPLPFEKDDYVVASNVEGHLQITIPLNPLRDILNKATQHYEDGKKRESIGLESYLPCENECKQNENGVFKCHTKSSANWDAEQKLYIEDCRRYENTDAMKLEKQDLDILSELWNVLIQLVTESPIGIDKRSLTALISIFSLIGTGITSLMAAYNSQQIGNLNKRAAISTQNDRIVSKSLRTIYNFGNATSENIDKITEATRTLYLAQTATERRIQLMEIDAHR